MKNLRVDGRSDQAFPRSSPVPPPNFRESLRVAILLSVKHNGFEGSADCRPIRWHRGMQEHGALYRPQPTEERQRVRCNGSCCSRCRPRWRDRCPDSVIASSSHPIRPHRGHRSGADAGHVHNRLPVREQINSF